MKDDTVYLSHILACIARIEEDSARGYRFLESSPTHQDAVLRNLQIMAESTQRLSLQIKDTQPHIHWSAIAGFRNILVHDYLGVDLEIVWDVISRDLPGLETAVRAMLNSLSADSSTSDQ